MQSNQKFKVRKANQSDLEFVHQAIVSVNDSKMGLHEFETLYKMKLKTSGFFIFILEEYSRNLTQAGLLVAHAQQNLADLWPTIEIQELFILPKYRKFGAADFLYGYLETFTKEQKVYRLKVNCKINSTLNQNFYTARGFKISKKQYVKEVY
jgi:GNAT superfamily N-acetyltransferase